MPESPDAAPAADPFDLARMRLGASAGRMWANGRRMRQLIELAAPRALRWLSVAAVIEAIGAVILPYSTKRMIDAVPLAHGVATVPLVWLLVEAGVVTVQTIARNLARYHTRVLEVRGAPFLAERVLEKTTRIAYRNLESSSFLDKLTRARQDAALYGVHYAIQLITVGRSLVMFAGCLGLLLWTAPLWTVPAVLAAAAVPFAFEVARARRSFDVDRKNLHRNRQGWYLEWLLSASEPAREIRATGVGTWLVALHGRIYAPFIAGQVAVARRLYVQGWLAAAATAIMMYGPYVYVLVGTVRGERTLGDLLLFALVFRQATFALAQLLTAFAAAFEHHLYIDNLLQVLDHPEDHPEDQSEDTRDDDTSPASSHVVAEAPALVLQDLWFAYPGAKQPVLRGLDLRVGAGETLAIVGRNGIGKTTLVKVLLGLYALDRGTITLAGTDVASRTLRWRRDNIGVVFQDFVRYQFSARWNVGLGWSADADDDAAVARALDMADARTTVDALARGLDTPLGAAFGGQDLSGGQWQRIALARLFMRRSRLWILDEPTSAMDPETEERTVRCFRQWTQGRTAIVITHRFSTARIADRIAVVDDGRVTEIGTHDELLAAGNDYARIFHLQARAYDATG